MTHDEMYPYRLLCDLEDGEEEKRTAQSFIWLPSVGTIFWILVALAIVLLSGCDSRRGPSETCADRVGRDVALCNQLGGKTEFYEAPGMCHWYQTHVRCTLPDGKVLR